MCLGPILSKEEIEERRKFADNAAKRTLYVQYPSHRDHLLVKIGSISRNFMLGLAVECNCGELLVISRHAMETVVGFRDDEPRLRERCICYE